MKKLNNIKIVFIDIDGTLVNKRKHITLRTKKAIKRIIDKNIYVVLTSGRDILHTIDKSKRALASSIVIASSGAQIYDYKQKEMLYSNEIDKETISKIWDYCNKKEIGIIIKTLRGKYINKFLIGKDKENSILITSKKELNNIETSQIILISSNLELMLKTKKYLSKKNLLINKYSDSLLEKENSRYILDINNQNVSKGIAIKILLKKLGLKKEESLCIGDYYNDLSMFRECSYKVAMLNACDEIKKEANYITTSNNKNGVAEFLNKYL